MPASLQVNRRTILGLAAGGTALACASTINAQQNQLRALAFDGFTVLDPRAVSAAVIDLAPERGAALASAWISKLFAFSWLETSAGRYSGFATLADAALQHSASSLGIQMTAGKRRDLVNVFSNLPLWPDSAATLHRLRDKGLRLAFLSNLSEDMLASNMRANDLVSVMDAPLSTDEVKAYKPSPRAYQMALDRFGLPIEEIGFVAFGGWDALGAKWFGYRTAWINRLGVTQETLDPQPDAITMDLSAALKLVETTG